MKKNIYTFLIILILISCSSEKERNKLHTHNEEVLEEISKINKVLELKEKELQLKELELELLKNKLNTEPKKLDEIYEDVKQSVYLLYTQNEKGLSQGSAFVISESGIAISNYHVFEDASDAILYNELNRKFLITEIIDYDEEKDFIVFRIGPITSRLPYLKIANFTPKIGERCFAVGNPRGLVQTLSEGIISSYRDNNTYIQTTTHITHGSSGGPLFNSSGEVIGITTMGINEEAGLNFALNLKEVPINEYLYKINRNTERLISENEIKELIKNYYYILNNEYYNELSKFYSNKLKRFYSFYDINQNEAINDAENYKKKYKIFKTSNEVRWNTLDIINSNGITIVQYIMDYEIVRQDKSKPSSFVLNIIMEINEEKKIQSIYENILTKN